MKRIPYEEWNDLTAEEQNDYIAHSVLPYVPAEDLRGNLLQSHMVIVEGKRCWKVEQRRGKPKIYPEFIAKAKSQFTMWCKFNPVWGDYRANLSFSDAMYMGSIDFGESHWNIWTVGGD
jgi:hypothetical protein